MYEVMFRPSLYLVNSWLPSKVLKGTRDKRGTVSKYIRRLAFWRESSWLAVVGLYWKLRLLELFFFRGRKSGEISELVFGGGKGKERWRHWVEAAIVENLIKFRCFIRAEFSSPVSSAYKIALCL